MNRTELVEKINSLKLEQTEWWKEFKFPEEIQEILNTCKVVSTNQNEENEWTNQNGEKLRWYETSVMIYELNQEYFGIRYLTQLDSESSDISDIGWRIKAVLMVAVPSRTFIEI